jgi:hypothetical protein
MAAYTIKMLVSGYQSIDLLFKVFSMKFDDGLFISVSTNRATHRKTLQLEIKKVPEKFMFSKTARPPFLTSCRFSRLVCIVIVLDLGHLHVRALKRSGICSKEESCVDGSKYVLFIERDRLNYM